MYAYSLGGRIGDKSNMQADFAPPPPKKSLNKKDWKAAFGKVVSSDSLGVFKKKLIVWFLQWV